MSMSGLPNSDHEEESGGILSEMNVTPLVDIFLVLLIIFMVTSSVMSQMGVGVDLPKTSPGVAKDQPKGVTVTLLPNGELQINGKNFGVFEATRFRTEMAGALLQTSDRMVMLEGDKRAFLGAALEVLNTAKQAGALKFAFATKTDESKKPE